MSLVGVGGEREKKIMLVLEESEREKNGGERRKKRLTFFKDQNYTIGPLVIL